jgi:hypothetical protein
MAATTPACAVNVAGKTNHDPSKKMRPRSSLFALVLCSPKTGSISVVGTVNAMESTASTGTWNFEALRKDGDPHIPKKLKHPFKKCSHKAKPEIGHPEKDYS